MRWGLRGSQHGRDGGADRFEERTLLLLLGAGLGGSLGGLFLGHGVGWL